MRMLKVGAALLGPMLFATLASADEPVIVWASSPVRPDETVLIAGHALVDLDSTPPKSSVELGVYPPDEAGDPNGQAARPPEPSAWHVIQRLRADAESVAATVPAEWPLGLWACRIRTASTASAPILLNAADAWWSQGDQGESASVGGDVRIFGKALAFAGLEPSVMLRTGGNATIPLPVTQVTPYAVTASVPRTCPAGSFEMWIHNGLGGPAGWQLAGAIDVTSKPNWKTERFNVRDFGPKPEAAIRAALAKADENGGGVVYLPRGRYGLTQPLVIPDGVVLAGESRELVSLFWADFESPPQSLISGKRFGLQDLSLSCQQHRHVVVIDRDSEEAFIHRIRIRANCHFMTEHPGKPFRGRSGPESNRNLGAGIAIYGRNFAVTDCDVLASDFAIYLVNAHHGRITGNTFLYGGRGYRIESSREIVFENNTVEGFGLTAIGNDIATFWSNACTHLFFVNNTLRRMFGADREMMTLDAGGGAYLGTVAVVDGNRLTLAADPVFKDYAPKPHQNWVGAAVMILEGKGVGQYRIVTAHQGRDWEVDRPWTVAPDAASVISIVPFRGRNLFIGNTCEDGGPFQLYGSAHECLVAENTGRRMDGFLVWGLDPHGWGQQPSWYCQFLDNTILEGNAYGHRTGGFGTAAAGAPGDGKGRSIRDVVYRRNACLNNSAISIGGNLQGALVEHNVIENSDVGISIRSPAVNVILRGNHFDNVVTPTKGDGLPEATVIPNP